LSKAVKQESMAMSEGSMGSDSIIPMLRHLTYNLKKASENKLSITRSPAENCTVSRVESTTFARAELE
jgi:hypothetical protein